MPRRRARTNLGGPVVKGIVLTTLAVLAAGCGEDVFDHGPADAGSDPFRIDSGTPAPIDAAIAPDGGVTGERDAESTSDALPAPDARAGADGEPAPDALPPPPCGGVCPGTLVCEPVSGMCIDRCRVGACPGPEICDGPSGLCSPPSGCDPNQPQPGGCANGQFCSSGVCADVPAPTCPAFDAQSHPPTWDPSDDAPVIHELTSLGATSGTAAESWCIAHGFIRPNDGFVRFRALVRAYWLSGFPAPEDVPALVHVLAPNGSETNGPRVIENVAVSDGGRTATFEINECRGPPTSAVTFAIHFEVGGVSGNEFCGISM